MRKKCLWCLERTVSLFGKYDIDSNICEECLISHSGVNKPMYGEWSRHTNAERNEFSKEILQPIKKDGTINKHFVEAHGTSEIEKNMKLSKRQIMENIEKYG